LLINDYDEKYSKYGLGISLLYHVIEKYYEENMLEYDFCGEAYDYKMKWADDVKKHVTLQIFNDCYYSNFIFLTKKTILPSLRKFKNSFKRA